MITSYSELYCTKHTLDTQLIVLIQSYYAASHYSTRQSKKNPNARPDSTPVEEDALVLYRTPHQVLCPFLLIRAIVSFGEKNCIECIDVKQEREVGKFSSAATHDAFFFILDRACISPKSAKKAPPCQKEREREKKGRNLQARTFWA